MERGGEGVGGKGDEEVGENIMRGNVKGRTDNKEGQQLFRTRGQWEAIQKEIDTKYYMIGEQKMIRIQQTLPIAPSGDMFFQELSQMLQNRAWMSWFEQDPN